MFIILSIAASRCAPSVNAEGSLKLPPSVAVAPLGAGVGVAGTSDVAVLDAGAGAAGAAGVWAVVGAAGVDGGFEEAVAVELAGADLGWKSISSANMMVFRLEMNLGDHAHYEAFLFNVV